MTLRPDSQSVPPAGLVYCRSAFSLRVIIRPPLVYGPGVKANFASLMRAVQRGVPLPLASVTHNRRSFVALDNLVDLLITCIDHPAAANQTFLVSDGEDLSTTDLLRRMGRALGRPARLLPVPPSMLALGAKAVLLKGGHLQGEDVVDVLLLADASSHTLRSKRISSQAGTPM